jgi:hypothetical protein
MSTALQLLSTIGRHRWCSAGEAAVLLVSVLDLTERTEGTE